MLLTRFRHALRSLHPTVEHLFGGDKEDVVRGPIALHHLQFLHQEVHAAVRVLPPHLEGHGSNIEAEFLSSAEVFIFWLVAKITGNNRI